jgi:hypothetical protein
MTETLLNLPKRLLKIVNTNPQIFTVRNSFWFVLSPLSKVLYPTVAKAP